MTRLPAAEVQILWTRLITVANEQAAALQRTSFTPIVRESGDLSAAVFDLEGRMIAQAVTGTPGHINSLATSMHHFLAEYPPDELRPGDVLITNDPWKTSGQLNDLSVVTPVFRGSDLVGFVGNTCHAVDIGGRGLSADGTEVFEEGLFIPITKLYAGGEANAELFRIIEGNVRAPLEVVGDLHAQVVGNEVGARRLVEYMSEFGLDGLAGLSHEIRSRSASAARKGISSLPDGVYRHVIHTDGLDDPIRIECAVHINGDEILVDYEGTSNQVDRGINVVLNYTAAYTTYALKCAIWPEVPHNDGSFEPTSVAAPEGSVLNPRFPAAVAARHVIGHNLPLAVFGALAPIIPDRVLAEGSANIWMTTVRGTADDRFVSVMFASGGTGARPNKDGLSATSFPSGIATSPVELIETTSPVRFLRKELRTDSGGPGRYRGGLGQIIEFEVASSAPFVVSTLCDRLQHPPAGYLGGASGAAGDFLVNGTSVPMPKLSRVLPPGSRVTLKLPGGGGFHPVSERDPDAVAADLAEGLIGDAAAHEIYGLSRD